VEHSYTEDTTQDDSGDCDSIITDSSDSDSEDEIKGLEKEEVSHNRGM
jgi:hypothetical protein